VDDCVFCKIIEGELPSMKIDEDASTLTFMDIHPLSSGHCLVVTKRHAATIFEADDRDLEAAMVTAKRVAPPSGSRSGRTDSTCSRPMARRPSSRCRTSICT